jgi:hypothetical protein
MNENKEQTQTIVQPKRRGRPPTLAAETKRPTFSDTGVRLGDVRKGWLKVTYGSYQGGIIALIDEKMAASEIVGKTFAVRTPDYSFIGTVRAVRDDTVFMCDDYSGAIFAVARDDLKAVEAPTENTKRFFIESEAFIGYGIIDAVRDDGVVLLHSEYSGRQFAIRKDELNPLEGAEFTPYYDAQGNEHQEF